MVRVVLPGSDTPLDVKVKTPRRTATLQAAAPVSATISSAQPIPLVQQEITMQKPELALFTAGGPGGAFDLPAFTVQLGKPPVELRGYTTFDGSWQHMLDCLDVAFDVYAGVDMPIAWSLGLCDTVENVAAGAARAWLVKVFQKILAKSRPTGDIWIRPAWEHTSDDYAWSSNGREAVWIKMFRAVVATGRSVSSRFKFEWCPAINAHHGATPVDPTRSWPGPYYVDRICFDMYLSGNPAVDHADDLQAWSYKLYGDGWGLNWLVAFGAQQNRPIGLGEFGFGRECEVFAGLLFSWIKANNVHAALFNAVDGLGDWRIFQYPQTAALFVEAFGLPAPAPSLWTPVPIDVATFVDVHGVTQKVQTARKPWSMARHAASNSYRYETRKGDIWSGDAGRPTEYDRSETESPIKLTIGQQYDYAFQARTTGTPLHATIISQLHPKEDVGDQAGHAEFQIRLEPGGRNRVITSYVTDNTPNATVFEQTLFDANDWVEGHVYNYVIRIKPSGGAPTGVLKVWRDGVLIVDRSNIRIGYPNLIGPYFKSGIYRQADAADPAPNTQVLEVFNLAEPTTGDLTGRIASPPAIPVA